MTANGKHPEQLLWFVAGQLDAAERASVALHLESCGECWAETEALASMMKSMVAQTRLDHVAPEDLVLFEEDAALPDSGKQTRIQRHLEECSACREDLEFLTRARSCELPISRPVRPARPGGVAMGARGCHIPASPAHHPKGRWLLAAAAGVVVMITLGLTGLTRREPVDGGPVPLKLIVLGAPQRGVESADVIDGPGPWAVRVLLPYGTAPQGYRVIIRRERQDVLPRLDTRASSDAEGCLDVIVPELPSPGRYELVLTPLTGDDTQEQVYPFEHLSSAAASPAG